MREDPERIIREHGVEKLMQSSEGRMIINRAREKYKAELVQPNHPEFKKLYGKEIKKREEIRKENERKADAMWKEKGGRERLHEI